MDIQDVEILTRRRPDAKALAAEWLMITAADWHTLALESTGRIVAAVPADRRQAATPCPGWDVRGLVNHLVSGNLRAAALGVGATLDYQLIEACRKIADAQIESLRAGGGFAEGVPVPAEASAQTRLLAMLGRRG